MTFDLTDNELIRKQADYLAELSDKFRETADDIIKEDDELEKQGYKHNIAARQDCFAISAALSSAFSAMLNLFNIAENLPKNINKMSLTKPQRN